MIKICAIVVITAGCAMTTQAQERSQYQRLGGYDALAAATDD